MQLILCLRLSGRHRGLHHRRAIKPWRVGPPALPGRYVTFTGCSGEILLQTPGNRQSPRRQDQEKIGYETETKRLRVCSSERGTQIRKALSAGHGSSLRGANCTSVPTLAKGSCMLYGLERQPLLTAPPKDQLTYFSSARLDFNARNGKRIHFGAFCSIVCRIDCRSRAHIRPLLCQTVL